MPATLDEILNTLLDSADFEEVASVSKAASFATAAKRFLILSPQSQADQGSSISMSVVQIENLLTRALAYVSANKSGGAGSVRFLGVGGGFR